MNDDQILAALSARNPTDGPSSGLRSPVSEAEMLAAEERLGFALPPLLRRIYREVADGGGGHPGHGLASLRGGEGLVETWELFRSDPAWPAEVLPCWDWGCAIRSCVDVSRPGGAIVTQDGEEPLTLTSFTVKTFLETWFAGVSLWDRLFGERRAMLLNPFTKKPIESLLRGNAIGVPWEPVSST